MRENFLPNAPKFYTISGKNITKKIIHYLTILKFQYVLNMRKLTFAQNGQIYQNHAECQKFYA